MGKEKCGNKDCIDGMDTFDDWLGFVYKVPCSECNLEASTYGWSKRKERVWLDHQTMKFEDFWDKYFV